MVGKLDVDEAFDYALRCEAAGLYEEAVAAYADLLAEDQSNAVTWFNLGNVLRQRGDSEAAESAYRNAVAVDALFARAWFNLAYVQDQTGRVGGAISSLEVALAAEPSYADAHFNLALLYEKVGAPVAKRHWLAYLALDRRGQWAEEAKRHLITLGGS